MKELSGAEGRLLIAAAEQGLFTVHTVPVTWVRTGGVDFIDTEASNRGCHDYALKYVKAFENLRALGYVAHKEGISYLLTDSGWEKARQLAAEEKASQYS